MTNATSPLTEAFLLELFPAERTNAFFDALFGDAEEGAYTIVLTARECTPTSVRLAFELHQRTDKCLVCSLTYGLPQVFQRHPVINVAGVVKGVADRMGWPLDKVKWELGRTEEHGAHLHCIPLKITRLI